MSTAKQNIERARGAAAELRWMAASIRSLLKLYGSDTILRLLLQEVTTRLKETENTL